MPRSPFYQPIVTGELADSLEFAEKAQNDIWSLGFSAQADEDIASLESIYAPSRAPGSSIYKEPELPAPLAIQTSGDRDAMTIRSRQNAPTAARMAVQADEREDAWLSSQNRTPASQIPGPDVNPESGTPVGPNYPRSSASASVPSGDPSGMTDEQWARAEARRLRIDPDIAVRVGNSEGGFEIPGRQSDVIAPNGKREESYSAYQLYLNGGLGNEALAAGIDPRDPKQSKAAITFALENAARNKSWAPFKGAARVGIGNQQGFGVDSPAPTAPPAASGAPQAMPQASARSQGELYPRQDLLDDPDKWAVCGPLGIMAFASMRGQPIDYNTAKEAARKAGWRPDQGMAGPQSQVAALNSLGIKSKTGPIDVNLIRQEVQNGNPVGLSSPGGSGHYFTVERVDDQGRMDLGNSALSLRASGGKRWFTVDELRRLGPIGAVDTAIYLDNPASPTPSVAAAPNAAQPGAAAPSPPSAPAPAVNAPSPQAAGGAEDQVSLYNPNTGQRAVAPRSRLDYFKRGGWVEEGAPQASMRTSDIGEAATDAPVSMMRNPINVPTPGDAYPEEDPFAADSGPREALPGSVGAQPLPQTYGPPLSEAGPERPTYEVTGAATNTPVPGPGIEVPVTPKPKQVPVWDANGEVIGYRQDEPVYGPEDPGPARPTSGLGVRSQATQQAAAAQNQQTQQQQAAAADLQTQRAAAQRAAVPGPDEAMRQNEIAESATRANQQYTPADRAWDATYPVRAPIQAGIKYGDDVNAIAARGVTDIMGEGQLGEEAASDVAEIRAIQQQYGYDPNQWPPDVYERAMAAQRRSNAIYEQGGRYASERAPGTETARAAAGVAIGAATMPLMPPLGEVASVLRTGTAAQRAAMAARIAASATVDPLGTAGQGVLEAPGMAARGAGNVLRAGSAAAERVPAPGEMLLGSGFVPNGGHRTVEVIQDQIETARSAFQRARAAGDTVAEKAASDQWVRLEGDLVDAQNARLALEPRITSDVGQRANPLTLTEESSDDLTDAMRPRETGRMRPEDLSGPVSVPVDDPRMRLGSGVVPEEAPAWRARPGNLPEELTPSIVPPEVARSLGGRVRVPNDAQFAEAVANTPGANITPDGLEVDLQRWQKPEQAGASADRVFYLPENSTSAHYAGARGFGGSDQISGPTLFQRPLVVIGQTGGGISTQALDDLLGQKLSSDISDAAKNLARAVEAERAGVPEIAALLERYGGDPSSARAIHEGAMADRNWDDFRRRIHYLVLENITATHVRGRGYDGIVAFDRIPESDSRVAKSTTRLTEVVDLREATYPTPEGGYSLRPEFGSQASGSGVIPSGLRSAAYNAAQGGVMGAASEDLQAASEGREADPNERLRRAVGGAGLAMAAGSRTVRQAGQRLGSGVVPDGAGGTRHALGNVPPSKLREPLLPGMDELPARGKGEIPIPETPGDAEALRQMRSRSTPLEGMPEPDFRVGVPPDAAERAAAALDQFPEAKGWIERASKRNELRMARQKIEPLSPLRWTARLVGNLGYTAMLGPGTATMNLALGIGEPLWSIPKETGRSLMRTGSLRESNKMAAGAFYGLGQVGKDILGAAMGRQGAQNPIVDVIKGAGAYAPNPNYPTLSAQTVNPVAQLVAQATEFPGRVYSSLPDAIFGTIAQHSGEYRAAAQIATDRGLKGAEWSKATKELLDDAHAVAKGELPTSPDVQRVVDEGAAYAKRQSLRDDLGTIGQGAKKVATFNNTPVLGTWATPFFTSIWNAGLRQAEKSPVGAVMNTAPTRFDKTYDALVGTAVIAGLANYAVGGGVTGSGPSDPKERELLQKEGWQPYSTLIVNPTTGDKHYVPNRMLALFETPLNVAGEIHDSYAFGKPDADLRAKLTEASTRVGKVIRQNPYALSGIASILEVPQFGLAPFLSDLATRVTPMAATSRTIGQANDTAERTTDRGKNVPLGEEIKQRWQLGTGYGRQDLPVAQDAFGQPKENARPGGWALLPNMPKAKDDTLVNALQEAKVTISQPPDEIEGVKLSPAQKRLFDATLGREMQEITRPLVEDPSWADIPPEVKTRLLERFKGTARKLAEIAVKDDAGPDFYDERVRVKVDKAMGR